MNRFMSTVLVGSLFLLSGCAAMKAKNKSRIQWRAALDAGQKPSANPEELFKAAEALNDGWFSGRSSKDYVGQTNGRPHYFMNPIYEGGEPGPGAKLLEKAIKQGSNKAIQAKFICTHHEQSKFLPKCKYSGLKKPSHPEMGKILAHLAGANLSGGMNYRGRWYAYSKSLKELYALEIGFSYRQMCALKGRRAWKKKWPDIPITKGVMDGDTSGKYPIYYPKLRLRDYRKVHAAAVAYSKKMGRRIAHLINRCSPLAQALVPGRAGLRLRERLFVYGEKHEGKYSDQKQWEIGQRVALAAAKGNRADLKKWTAQLKHAQYWDDRAVANAKDTEAFNNAQKIKWDAVYAKMDQDKRDAAARGRARRKAKSRDRQRQRDANYMDMVKKTYSKKNNPILKRQRRYDAIDKKVRKNRTVTRSTRRSTSRSASRPTSRSTRRSRSRSRSRSAPKTASRKAQRTSTRPDPLEMMRRECLLGGHKWTGSSCKRTWNIKVPGHAMAKSGKQARPGQRRRRVTSKPRGFINNSSDSEASPEQSSNSVVSEKGEELGPEMMEALAYCWQNEKRTKWRCHGTTQDTAGFDTQEKVLRGGGCLNPGRSMSFGKGLIFFCGRGMRGSDDDIAAKYDVSSHILVQRKTYQCKRFQQAHCTRLK